MGTGELVEYLGINEEQQRRLEVLGQCIEDNGGFAPDEEHFALESIALVSELISTLHRQREDSQPGDIEAA